MRWIVVAAVVPAMAISGCATKNYGRLQPLTGAERVAYSCRDVDIEIAKVGAFQAQVAEGAQFNMGRYSAFSATTASAIRWSAVPRTRRQHGG